MNDAGILHRLAEAVTDGSDPDWDAAASSMSGPQARAIVGHLRAASRIGRARATLLSIGSAVTVRAVPLDLKAGDSWGGLRILSAVGCGRFGDVYRAWDSTLEREVALKILRQTPDAGDDSVVVDEGRLMARVRHPNVLAIYGAQRIEGRTGLWMEFVHGQTLEAELDTCGPLDADALTTVGVELCAALEAVHAAGLVHRDVKAANVLRGTTGRIVLGDFGTGRELDKDRSLQGELAGTPAYFAPEIFDRQPATAGSDIYSLGVLLFHLTTRDYPVKGRTVAALRAAHKALATVSLRTARPDLPAELTAAIDRALDSDPSRRFSRANELSLALSAWRGARARRSRMRAAAVGVGVAALVLLALSGLTGRGDSTPATGAPGDRDWVLVTAAINRTGESVLDGTIEYALERELSHSSYINVVPRTRVVDILQLMQRPADTRLDPDTSREIALRDGEIDALVAGRVDKVGDTYGVSVDVTNPADGVRLATISEPPVPVNDLLKAVGRAAIAVRQRLGEGLTLTQASRLELAKVTTPSLKSLQLYSQVNAMLDGQGGFIRGARAGEQLMRAAIAEDPGFASAYALLAETINVQSGARLHEALKYVEQAVALSARETEVERLRIEGSLAMQSRLSTDPAERRRWLEHGVAKNEAVLNLQPNHYEALVTLTNLYAQLGRPSAPLARRLSDLRPQSVEWAARAAIAAMWEGDLDTARRYAQRGNAVPLLFPTAEDARGPVWVRLFDAFDAWLQNDAAGAAAVGHRVASELDRLSPDARSPFAFQLTYLHLMLGQLSTADTLAAQIANPVERKTAHLRIALASQDIDRISQVLRRDYPTIEAAAPVASTLIAVGRIEDARRAVVILRSRPATSQTFIRFIEGQLALNDGRIDEAIAGIEAYLEGFAPGQRYYVPDTLAKALTARGDDDRAIAVLEEFSHPRFKLVAQPGVLAFEWLGVRDRLAILYRQAGRDKEADAVEAELRALLAVADDDHPIKRRLDQRHGR